MKITFENEGTLVQLDDNLVVDCVMTAIEYFADNLSSSEDGEYAECAAMLSALFSMFDYVPGEKLESLVGALEKKKEKNGD